MSRAGRRSERRRAAYDRRTRLRYTDASVAGRERAWAAAIARDAQLNPEERAVLGGEAAITIDDFGAIRPPDLGALGPLAPPGAAALLRIDSPMHPLALPIVTDDAVFRYRREREDMQSLRRRRMR